jgi:hypothetical protein
LRRVAGADTGNQPQGSADEALRFAGGILLIVEEQSERVGGCVELRLEPGRIEQQRVQLVALTRFGEMMWTTKVKVAASPLVRSLAGTVE